MRHSHLKIGTRLALGFSLVCGLLLLIVGIATTILSHINEAAVGIASNTMQKLETVSMIQYDVNDIAAALSHAILTDYPDDRRALVELAVAKRVAIEKSYQALDPAKFDTRGRELLEQARAVNARYTQSQEAMLKLIRSGDDDGARTYITSQLRPVVSEYKKTVEAELTYQKGLVIQAAAEGQEKFQLARNLLVGLGLTAVALSAAAAWWITRSITRPMTRALEVADTVASGDLNSRIDVDRGDETGQLLASLKRMNENLATTVDSVRSGTRTINAASTQVASGSLELSARTEQQANALQDTAASMEELTSTVKQNADNAQQANALAQAASLVAARGGAVIEQVVGTMTEIDHSASKIADIIGVIDAIAFQTNILALNAAVEAARAGEQGRGFEVVASEVRNLAQRSAAAAKEIKALIETSTDKVSMGGKLVGEAGATMREIVDSVRRVTDMMSEISAASQEQTVGIERINCAVTEMDEMTQQNAALVEETSAAAEAMRHEAERLAQAVSAFKLGASDSQHPAYHALPHAGSSLITT
jgi:methyl-accepting chemotaxis protein